MSTHGVRRSIVNLRLLLVAGLVSCGATTSSAEAPARRAAPVPARHAPGVNAKQLAKLVQRAEQSKSDALVVMKDGVLVGEWYFGKAKRPIEAMSATKSIVNLAIGKLIDSGRIKSLDQPIFEFFPEWRQGAKQKVTVRHLLNHTSGLQNVRSTMVEIYPSPDFVKLALAAELTAEPGSQFAYNNKAVNLLAGVVKVASGKRMDEYIRDEIFRPMGITELSWTLDAAGNPHAMSGLQIHARDLANIGQMLLDGGVWKGQRILSKEWIAESTRPSQPLSASCGLLWWLLSDFRMKIADDALIAEWRKAGASDEFLQKVLPLKDKVFTDRSSYAAALTGAFGGKAGLELWHDNTWRKGQSDGRSLPSPVTGFYAAGFLGQYLVVLPKERIVAVRQLEGDEDGDPSQVDGLDEFPQLVRQLASP